MTDNESMKRFSKPLALFLILLIFCNGLFAAQMIAPMPMAEHSMEMVKDEPPCHSEQTVKIKETVEQKAIECCQGDCNDCVLSSVMHDSSTIGLPHFSPTEKLTDISNYLLPAHTANLYRPPILI